MDVEKFCCSVCLDLLRDPVTIPCGHNYCMSCVKSHWDEEDLKAVYSCPQCRKSFSSRPVLVKNNMLADLVEELKKAGQSISDQCYAQPGDVACDFCRGRKLKAVKSCLQCLVSYCEQHLQPHYESPAFEKHKLVDPDKMFQEIICPHHKEEMKIFCRTDLKCICYVCSIDDHKDHDTVSAAAERMERQKELGEMHQKIERCIKVKEGEAKELEGEADAICHSADKAVTDSDKFFSDLLKVIEKRGSDVKQQIKTQQKTEESRVRERREDLAAEIDKLRRNGAELEALSRTDDHIQFLHSFTSLSSLIETTGSSGINNQQKAVRYFEGVATATSHAKEKLEDVLSFETKKIIFAARSVDVLLPQPEPKTREDLVQYSYPISIDSNTAEFEVLLSEGDRKATVLEPRDFGNKIKQGLFRLNPKDFPSIFCGLQVLSQESLSGRCYWEVEWSGVAISVAVAYDSVRNNLHTRCFGYDDRSWAINCTKDFCEFRHNNIKSQIPLPWGRRVGVYLDHKAGLLVFFGISGLGMIPLHEIQTTFTEPLYAGLLVGYESTAEFK